MNKFALIAAVAAVAGCASMDSPEAATPDADNDQCRASAYQYLVGKNRSEIPSTPNGAVWRVSCSTCPVTMDYNPRRMNIVYDDASGVIQKVTCG